MPDTVFVTEIGAFFEAYIMLRHDFKERKNKTF